MPRKLLDSTKLRELGWSPTTSLDQGLKYYYDWFLRNQNNLRETVYAAVDAPSLANEDQSVERRPVRVAP